jgi:precorrin-2 dehydrogenase/sirohydrochlorin ferrochelatase
MAGQTLTSIQASKLTRCRMSKVCEQWQLDELVSMTEEDMDMLLGFYTPGTVPSLEQLRLQEPGGAFDGPFLI